MKQGISVIICCYNGAPRLHDTLAHLANQKHMENIPWEVLVIDNNSSDGTAEVARKCWEPYKEKIDFRVISEPTPGTMYARERGVKEMKYNYILFVDDDNWMCDTYVSGIYQIIQAHPEIAAAGGEGIAQFPPGVAEPEWFEELKGAYATGPQAKAEGYIEEPRGRGTLYGAGICIKKKVWLQMKEANFSSLLIGRIGNKTLAPGDDTELGMVMRLAGYKLWFTPDLTFKHLLPEGRLNWDYVQRMFRGFGVASITISIYRAILKGDGDNPAHRWKRQLLRYLYIYTRLRVKYFFSPPTTIEPRTYLYILEGKIQALWLQKSKFDAKFQVVEDLQKRLQALRAKQ